MREPKPVVLHPARWPATACAVLLFACTSAACAEQTLISWHVFSLPPLYMVDGARKNEGISDLALQRQLIPRLSAYDHRIVQVHLCLCIGSR